MDIQFIVDQIQEVLINWPLFIYVIGVSILCTIAFRFIQLRYFVYAWKQVLFPPAVLTQEKSTNDMTPMQAFINTLSTNLGNGAIAGTATAIYSGGPGAALWILVFGLLVMSVRFAEVFLSVHFGALAPAGTKVGGPMLYLRQIPAGAFFAYVYAVICLWFGFVGGNSIQTNSIRVSLVKTFGSYGLTPMMCAVALVLFTLYVVYGGAHRIVKVSEKIVPLKVIVFFSTTLCVLFYHYAALVPALRLMFHSAFTTTAASGALLGFTVQQAIRYGMTRAVFATESGLGTAAILFGFTGGKTAVKDGILSTLSTFLSTLVCFIVALCIVASGVWNSGLSSTELTIASFQTVFGSAIGAGTVTFLSVTFGIGVLVSYAYITQEVWLYLTNGKWVGMFALLYAVSAFAGALLDVRVVWDSSNIMLGFMLFINLFGIVYLIPVIRKSVTAFINHTR